MTSDIEQPVLLFSYATHIKTSSKRSFRVGRRTISLRPKSAGCSIANATAGAARLAEMA
jgi:hypothetical protein